MVRDHIGEVAVMRALGCSRLPVAAVLIVEAMLIGLGGAAVGASLPITLFGHGFTLGALTARSVTSQ